MEYLALREIRAQKKVIIHSLQDLLKLKALVGKPGSRQWLFLQACLQRLFNPKRENEFDYCPAVIIAQYKFEVEDSLRRFYLRPGYPVPFVFALVHKSKLPLYGVEDKEYPSLGGYCLLVRDYADTSHDRQALLRDEPRILKPYLEKVVAEAMEAEFQAYAALPEIRMKELERWFCSDGPALKEVLRIVYQYHKAGWIISNPLNPSTKRLLNIKIRKIEAKEAVLATTEYWYLLWWDPVKRLYMYPYRETNHQIYILHKTGAEEWKVFENLKPPPRATAPHRRKK